MFFYKIKYNFDHNLNKNVTSINIKHTLLNKVHLT